MKYSITRYACLLGYLACKDSAGAVDAACTIIWSKLHGEARDKKDICETIVAANGSKCVYSRGFQGSVPYSHAGPATTLNPKGAGA